MRKGAFLLVLGSIAAAGGCSQNASPAPHDLRSQRLSELEAMGQRCRYPHSGWRLVGTEELHLKPDPNERYEVVDCMLLEFKKSDIPYKIGFVENEAYEPGNGQ